MTKERPPDHPPEEAIEETGDLYELSDLEDALTDDEDLGVDFSPVGLWLALAGAAATVIAVFLPEAESTTFARVAENTLIQSGDGWFFVGLALSAAVTVYRAYKSRRRTWGPMIAGGIGIAYAIYIGTSSDALRLCSVDPATFGQNCEQANPGIGIYMAGIGSLLMLVGGWQIRSSRDVIARGDLEDRRDNVGEGVKRCPDCAETVLEAARVCKHCGFRFDGLNDPA